MERFPGLISTHHDGLNSREQARSFNDGRSFLLSFERLEKQVQAQEANPKRPNPEDRFPFTHDALLPPSKKSAHVSNAAWAVAHFLPRLPLTAPPLPGAKKKTEPKHFGGFGRPISQPVENSTLREIVRLGTL
jgi:hypothetical protein